MKANFIRFSRQTLIGAVSTGLGYARWIMVMPLLTRGFGTEGYGIWVQLFFGVELLAGLTNLGLNFALLRYTPTRNGPREASADLWASILVCWVASLPLMGMGLVLGDWLARTFFGGPGQTYAVRLALLLIPVSGSLNLVFSYLRGARHALTHANLVILESCGWLGLATAVHYLGVGLQAMIVGLLVVKGMTLTAGAVIILWRGGSGYPRLAAMLPCLRYGIPLLPMGVLHWVLNASDRYFLSYCDNPESVSIYSVSYSLGSIVGLVYAPIYFGLIPAVSAAWHASRKDEVLEYLRFAQKYPFLLVVPAIILLAAYADQMTGVIATSQFAATPALIVCVAIAIVVMNIGAIAQTILNVVDQTQRILVISIGAAFVNLVANAIAIPRYGTMGAALATLISYVFYTLATHVMCRSTLVFPWAWRTMGKAGLAALPLLLVLSVGISQPSWGLVGTCCGCIAYIGILFALGIFEGREWQLVRALVSREPKASC